MYKAKTFPDAQTVTVFRKIAAICGSLFQSRSNLPIYGMQSPDIMTPNKIKYTLKTIGNAKDVLNENGRSLAVTVAAELKMPVDTVITIIQKEIDNMENFMLTYQYDTDKDEYGEAMDV